MSGTGIVVDAGRSGCRAAAVNGDVVIRPAVRSAGLPLVASEGGPEAAAEAVAVAVRQVTEAPESVTAGLTGLFECMDRAPELADRLRAATGAARVLVTGDVVTSHAGALGGQPGVVIAAGTGTVALGVAPDGRWTRVDGWGFTIGDAGSGFAIGRAGLRAAMRQHDGRGGSPALAEYAARRYGSLDRLAAKLYASGNLAGEVATFAPDVAAAARAGDALANGIWQDAARELAQTAAAAAERVHGARHDVLVAWSGALFDAADLLTEPFQHTLLSRCPYAFLIPARGDALDGAALLSTGHARVLERLIMSF